MATKTRTIIALDIETNGLEARWNKDVDFWCACLYGDAGIDELYTDIHKLHLRIVEIMCLANDVLFVFHNAAFDVAALRVRGINIPEEHYTDTMGMAYCLEPDAKKSLSDLSQKYLRQDKLPSPVFDTFSQDMADYCRQDTVLTYNLYHKLNTKLSKDAEALEFWNTIEKPYIECIIEMQTNGALIDPDVFDKVYKETEANLKEAHKHLKSFVKRAPSVGLMAEPFNFNSTQQVAKQLMKYGWKPTKFGKSGQPSVDKSVLSELASEYPFAEAMVTYNKWSHYMSNTINVIAERRVDDRIHGSFNQFKVRTGRLSSSSPNLQNIPARGDRGDMARSMFTAPEGWDVVVGDLDRIELVVLAFYLESVISYPNLANQIRQGIDIHSMNASRWHGVPVDTPDFKQKHRKPCKNGVFSLIYGAGVKKFANTISISLERANKLVKHDELLVAVDELKKYVVAQAIKNRGVLHGFMGRRLYVPEVLSKNRATKASGVRKVFNYLIQGTAGDIFKYLQLKARTYIEDPFQDPYIKESVKQIIVVHDEAMYYVEETLSHKIAEQLTNIYSDEELLVTEDTMLPISCEFNVGSNWLEAKGD